MGKQLFLVHWNQEEASQFAENLIKKGWTVEIEAEDGERAVRRIEKMLPDAVIIYLNKLPSHGLRTGRELHMKNTTCHLPLIFVNGSEANRAKLFELIPHALISDDESLLEKLTAVIIQY